MSVRSVRLWLVLVSLFATGALAAFLLVAPSMGYPLRFDQALRLLESVAPTFATLLGSATIFLIRTDPDTITRLPESRAGLLTALAFGPIVVFAVILLAAFLAFDSSNSAMAPPGTGMTVDNLAHALAFGNGLLALTTTAIAGWLFEQEKSA